MDRPQMLLVIFLGQCSQAYVKSGYLAIHWCDTFCLFSCCNYTCSFPAGCWYCWRCRQLYFGKGMYTVTLWRLSIYAPVPSTVFWKRNVYGDIVASAPLCSQYCYLAHIFAIFSLAMLDQTVAYLIRWSTQICFREEKPILFVGLHASCSQLV
jgi:hypothetical protein